MSGISLKSIFVGYALGIILIMIGFRELLQYGLMQGQGQLNILLNTRSVDEVLRDSLVADSVKTKLRLVQDIRDFATSELGIFESPNYTTVYDQKGKDILWVVTASEQFSMTPKQWKFPVVGTVSYKGFFDLNIALEERNELKRQGYDTQVRSVGAWSTLGWFKDPILTNMLSRDEANLANLIIHELTHGTLFVKDSITFNENLASFIGHIGTEKYLDKKYGKSSMPLRYYQDGRADSELFINHIVRGAKVLDSLYGSFITDLDSLTKADAKSVIIDQIITSLDTVSFKNSDRYRQLFIEAKPNNAYFMSFVRYRSRQDEFKNTYHEMFEGDVRGFIVYLKDKFDH